MADIQSTLAERGETYGKFIDVAGLSQGVQEMMHRGRNWERLRSDQREALQTIASKIARILNGDADHIDSWHDISGYATLVEDRLREDSLRRQHVIASG